MRSAFFCIVITVATLAVLAVAPGAQAQWVPGVNYSASPYYPQVYGYPYPGVYGYPYGSYYNPPYVWSGQRYVTPYQRGWFYERYYPSTNQYYYQYRVRPQYYWGY
jgi:hypothetical protein